MLKQRTIKQQVKTVGVGVHSGTKVDLILRPAPANAGIVFTRIDLQPPVLFPAQALNVGDTRMASICSGCTAVRENGPSRNSDFERQA